MTPAKSDSLSQRVLAVVKDDPGVNVAHISERLNVDRNAISNTLAYHRREGRIQNLGKHAKGASWYPQG